MKELDFAELVERFDEILDAIEEGETFRVFRNGQPIALMCPSALRNSEQIIADPASS